MWKIFWVAKRLLASEVVCSTKLRVHQTGKYITDRDQCPNDSSPPVHVSLIKQTVTQSDVSCHHCQSDIESRLAQTKWTVRSSHEQRNYTSSKPRFGLQYDTYIMIICAMKFLADSMRKIVHVEGCPSIRGLSKYSKNGKSLQLQT
jgi:hypothetical protein